MRTMSHCKSLLSTPYENLLMAASRPLTTNAHPKFVEGRVWLIATVRELGLP